MGHCSVTAVWAVGEKTERLHGFLHQRVGSLVCLLWFGINVHIGLCLLKDVRIVRVI